MDRKCIYDSTNDINIGDIILIKKDFDTNSKTKKLKIDTSYSMPRKVTEILSNNRIKVEIMVLKKLWIWSNICPKKHLV